MSTITGQSLIDGVVHCFINQVVQAFLADVTNVHSRTLSHCLQTFENLDITSTIIASADLLCFFHYDLFLSIQF